MVQHSHPYMTTGKPIALIIWTFVIKVMSLFFNMLSRFLSFSSKEQTSFNFVAVVTICSHTGAQENKIYHCFNFFPIYLPWSDRIRCYDLSFMNEFKVQKAISRVIFKIWNNLYTMTHVYMQHKYNSIYISHNIILITSKLFLDFRNCCHDHFFDMLPLAKWFFKSI